MRALWEIPADVNIGHRRFRAGLFVWRIAMLQISAQQLAELLSGIARAQAAVVLGLETATPGTRGNYVLPAIQNVSHLRDHPNPTLVDIPVRMLLSYMGRIGPDIDAVARELERLLGGDSEGEATQGAPNDAKTDEPPAEAGDSLDFSVNR
jgi:hypothetical protein